MPAYAQTAYNCSFPVQCATKSARRANHPRKMACRRQESDLSKLFQGVERWWGRSTCGIGRPSKSLEFDWGSSNYIPTEQLDHTASDSTLLCQRETNSRGLSGPAKSGVHGNAHTVGDTKAENARGSSPERLVRLAMQPTQRVTRVARGALSCCAAPHARKNTKCARTRTLIGKFTMVCFQVCERARAASRNPACSTRARDTTQVQKEFWSGGAPMYTNWHTVHFPAPALRKYT